MRPRIPVRLLLFAVLAPAVGVLAVMPGWFAGSASDGVQASAGGFTQVSAGYLHTCGVRTDGTLACWGGNSDGQATPPDGTFTQVSAGYLHTCGVRTDGTLACWGRNDSGQATPPSPADGGIAGLADIAGKPLGARESSGRNLGLLAAIAAVTAGVLALGGAAWYARRRWRAG